MHFNVLILKDSPDVYLSMISLHTSEDSPASPKSSKAGQKSIHISFFIYSWLSSHGVRRLASLFLFPMRSECVFSQRGFFPMGGGKTPVFCRCFCVERKNSSRFQPPPAVTSVPDGHISWWGVDAHIGKSQFPPELAPEQKEVAEGLSRRMAEKQPRITGSTRHGAKNFQCGVG